MVGGRIEKQCSTSLVPVNISEEEGKYKISVFAPGISREDLKVSVEKNTLAISFQKTQAEDEKESYIRKEYEVQSFERSFKLPENAEIVNIAAEHKNGILHITIPKKAKVEIPVQEIEVK
jgi:HSP20 family protein